MEHYDAMWLFIIWVKVTCIRNESNPRLNSPKIKSLNWVLLVTTTPITGFILLREIWDELLHHWICPIQSAQISPMLLLNALAYSVGQRDVSDLLFLGKEGTELPHNN